MLNDPIIGSDPVVRIVAEASRYWWLHLIRGVAAVIFGLIAIAYPGITVLFLAVLVAVWALILGFTEITQGWRLRQINRRFHT
ncbi:MAG TPA: DUF308 domain-containing protein [Candidatus Dormibacteraeota bacterium]|jgi:uncharacterized membrane protein HdeD (DUF308 family)